MHGKTSGRWIALVLANATLWCVLGFQKSDANMRAAAPAGPTAVEQRAEMIVHLRDIKSELRQLNQRWATGALPIPNP